MNKLPDIQEKKLLLSLRDGDHHAFNALYDFYAKSIYIKLKRLVHLPEVAEEIHQDIFMAIWTEREKLSLDIPFQSILYRKAKNVTADFYRKASRDKNLYNQLLISAVELYDEIEERIDFKETNESLMKAIAKLPEQRQKVFIRIKIDGKSYEEVAEEFGVSISTVKDHMTRALKLVRKELVGHYPTTLFIILATALLKH